MAREKLKKTRIVKEDSLTEKVNKKKRRRLKIFAKQQKKPQETPVQDVLSDEDKEYEKYAREHAQDSDDISVESMQRSTIKLSGKERARQKKRRKRNEARQKNSARHKRKLKKNRSLQMIISLIFIAVIGVTLSLTVFFNIENINVVAPQTFDESEIVSSAAVEVNQNLFRTNLAQIEENIIADFVLIDEVIAKRDLPNTLTITVNEAVPSQAYTFSGDYYIISENKRIIDKVTDLAVYPNIQINSGLDFAEYEIGDFINNDDDFDTINIVTNTLLEVGLGDINSIEIYNETQIKLIYDNRITIELGNVLDIEYKLALVKEVIDEKIGVTEQGVIDASSDGTVYFRPIAFSEQ